MKLITCKEINKVSSEATPRMNVNKWSLDKFRTYVRVKIEIGLLNRELTEFIDETHWDPLATLVEYHLSRRHH